MTSRTLAAKKGQKHAAGRGSEQVYESLRQRVLTGKIAVGRFLPTEREMAEEHGVAHTTVRRAMDKLKAEGLIRAEPRKGYRVLDLANDPTRGCPVAYVRSEAAPSGSWDEFHRRVIGEIQAVADRRGWSLLTMGAGAGDPAGVVARLKAARAFSVILDTHDQGIVDAVRKARLPALMVDSWVEGVDLDSVMQDGHHGGMLAARHLAGLGCRRIAWFGPDERSAHEMDRFGGFAAGLFALGRAPDPELLFSSPEAEALAGARKVLAGPRRPDAVVALWSQYASALKQAADEAGLVVGRDFQMVGWCPEELYAAQYAPGFAAGAVPPPTVTWSIRTMADTAVARLAERRENPALPPLRVKVPVRLRPAGRG
jgi:DNA-binding LacI/PurR family transcriptional regulator/biotin operon repressor